MSVLINLLFFMLSCFAVYKAYKRNEKSHVIVKVLSMIFAFFMSIPYLIGILIYDKFVKGGSKSGQSAKITTESKPGITDSVQSDSGQSNQTTTDLGKNSSKIDTNDTIPFVEKDVE